jgi:uncharacterized protein DUF6527
VNSQNSRVNTVQYQGAAESHDDAKALLKKAGDISLVQRGRPRSIVMFCPCGCRDELVINLDSRIGPAWHLYRNKKGTTLYPSFWRESGCGSHFIIWGNRIYWCDYDSLWDESYADPELSERVLELLKGQGFLHYKDIAELLGDIPWSVLLSCRRLVKQGSLREGTNKSKGYFQLIK